ncbi:probable oxidoreductase (short-chain dehydrogenase family) [Natronomonas pharaonis DSM 2160]|uniref:Peroxisomal trans-2-enoyl-CoA reductase n=1 Tax=Natronomonas pharaonis (strain ATCC 35678 / DSM 2160 / CIP 103997 / JCM 8858 / NBRC 14720 / NCIMB 2260 / Gabara) TaxID=348780 RepID=A0A1U7EXP0_NATPD|nr:SDR family oxidoreductase [Natronomonas pharaonis]CAI49942.1 probable oxidoreductase (short-chain dehydrogenase family) [Natronomonas pharaonis DSM 2160]
MTDEWPQTPPTTELFADDLLAGETALITGGGTGIGKAMAVAFAEHGADVAVASRDMDHLRPVVEAAEDAGADAFATTVDIRKPEAVEEMTATVLDELGDISILVNNAGANFVTPFEELSPNGWRAVVGTILDGTAYCTMTVGEHLIERGGGVVLSMGATNSVHGAPFHAHSGAGKAGVHNLMQTVASEWADHGVRANTIAPGIIETEGVTEAAGGALPPELLEDIPADRFGTPADCVSLALFLASPAAAYVTGGYYPVDGGQLLFSSPY